MKISIDTQDDYEAAEQTRHDLENARDGAPGWLSDELGLDALLARLEAAMDRFTKQAER